jgi:hypothetical protein
MSQRIVRLPAYTWNYAVVLAIGCGHAPPPPACAFEVVLAGRGDVARTARCETAGRVAIRTGAPLDVSTMRLREVSGDLVIGPSVGVDEIRLPELREIHGALRVVGNGDLHGLYLPALVRVARIEIAGNVALTTIALPKLAAVDGGIAITDNSDLEMIDTPALTTIGGSLAIANDPNLALVEMPTLARAGSVRVEACPKLPAETVDALTSRRGL